MNSLIIAMNLFKRVFSDKKGLFTGLLLPVLVISLIVAFVGDDSAHPVSVGYVNLDEGALGARLVEQLSGHEEYALVAKNEQELRDEILDGKLPIGMIIPSDFTDSLLAGRRRLRISM